MHYVFLLFVAFLMLTATPVPAEAQTVTRSYQTPSTRTTTVIKKEPRKRVTTKITRTTYGSPPPYCREFQQSYFLEGTLRNYTQVKCRQPGGRWVPE